MKFLLYLFIVLCFLLLWGHCDLDNEVSGLREEVGLLKEQITGLQSYVDVTDNKCDRIKAEVRDMVRPFTRVIPVAGGFLGVKEEKP